MGPILLDPVSNLAVALWSVCKWSIEAPLLRLVKMEFNSVKLKSQLYFPCTLNYIFRQLFCLANSPTLKGINFAITGIKRHIIKFDRLE